MGWASWRAERADRSEFVKASQARIWRIVAVAIVAILGATFAVVAFTVIVHRLSRDESCLRSVAAASSQRSDVLSRLSKQRSDADQRRQNWNTREQQLFARALSNHPLPRPVLRREFARANRHYLRADAIYRQLNTRYNQAAQAHPVPKLNCDNGRLNQPAPTVTATSTTTRTAHSTATATRTMPGHGATRVIVRPGPTTTRTVFAPPGKGRTVTVTKTATVTPRICTPVPGVKLC